MPRKKENRLSGRNTIYLMFSQTIHSNRMSYSRLSHILEFMKVLRKSNAGVQRCERSKLVIPIPLLWLFYRACCDDSNMGNRGVNSNQTRQAQTADSTPRPRVATWEVVPYTSVGLQLGLLCTLYSQAQGCVCTALQLGGDVEQPWLMSKYDVIHNRATAIGSMRKKFGEDMIADRQKHTHR